ncbi:MAG: hypothetical protein K0Q48_1511 [Bacillota bacterium]|nr:hypothetical protein [Bacillota bacterium]
MDVSFLLTKEVKAVFLVKIVRKTQNEFHFSHIVSTILQLDK